MKNKQAMHGVYLVKAQNLGFWEKNQKNSFKLAPLTRSTVIHEQQKHYSLPFPENFKMKSINFF